MASCQHQTQLPFFPHHAAPTLVDHHASAYASTMDIMDPVPENLTNPKSALLSIPPEVQISIFQSCSSYTQALSLASTCKQLHSLWQTHSTSIVSYIGRNSIPAFNDALLAIRATDQAIEYYNYLIYTANSLPTAGKAPPSRVSLAAISPTARKSTIPEVKRVLDLKLFVDYSLFLSHGPGAFMHLACLIQNSSYLKLDTKCSTRDSAELRIDPENADLVEARVYASMYRLFTISAVLTNIYFEPFFELDNPVSVRLRKAYELYWPRHVDENPEDTMHREYHEPIRKLKRDEVQFLMQFECFNKKKMVEDKEGSLGDVFDQLAEHFCRAGAKESAFDCTIYPFATSSATQEPPDSNTTKTDTRTDTHATEQQQEQQQQRASDGDPIFSTATAAEIQQIMMLNTCYEVWIRMRERIDMLREPVRLTHEKLLYSLNKDSIKLVTIPIVFQAIYGVGDAMMPASLTDFKSHPYGPVPPNLQGKDSHGDELKHIEVPDVLYQLIHEGYIRDLGPGADLGRAYFEFGWPEYGFFEWVMKRRFGMRICWGWEYVDERYNKWIREGRVFTELASFRKLIPGVLDSVK